MPLFARIRRRLSVRTRRASSNETQLPLQDVVVKNQLASPVSVLDDGSFAFHVQKHAADSALAEEERINKEFIEEDKNSTYNDDFHNDGVRFAQDFQAANNNTTNEYSQSRASSVTSLSEPTQLVNSQCLTQDDETLEEYSAEKTWTLEGINNIPESSKDSRTETFTDENMIGEDAKQDREKLESLSEVTPLKSESPILQDLTNLAAFGDHIFSSSTNADTGSSVPEKHVRVFIEKGRNKDNEGNIISLKDAGTYEVQLDSGRVVNVRKTSVRYLENVTSENTPRLDGVVSAPTSTNNTTVKRDVNADIGKRVIIAVGKNKGKCATIVRLKNKRTYEVKLDESEELVGVRVTSVEFISNVDASTMDDRSGSPRLAPALVPCADHTRKTTKESAPTSAAIVESAAQNRNVMSRVAIPNGMLQSVVAEPNLRPKASPSNQPTNKYTPGHNGMSSKAKESSKPPRKNTPCKHDGQKITIKSKGPNQGKTGTIVGRSNRGTYNVRVGETIIGVRDGNAVFLGDSSDAQGRAVSLDGQSQRSSATTRSRSIANTFRLPGTSGGGWKIGNLRVTKFRAVDPDDARAKEDTTFLSHLLSDRMVVQEVPMRGPKQKKFASSFEHNGIIYELVSAKIEEDKESSFNYGKPKVARLIYADTSCSPDGHKLSIKDMLSKFGDFSVLQPRKIMARLELFQSPAKFPIYEIDDSCFCEIKEHGHVGCGFISGEFLQDICIRGGIMSKQAAALVSAIQVRLFIPSKGIYKGMLQRKQIDSGPQVQLPPSMQKVLASVEPDHLGRAAILVCKNGVFPSPGSANEYIGRRLDPERKPPPEKSFKAAIKKPLNDMVLKLWKSLGVPQKEMNKYKRDSVKTDRRNHAWIVGVADPTATLPPDHVFVPGMGDAQPPQIFVTRSPCLKHDDGRMLKTVVSKPESMSEKHWDELQSLPFGSIVFACPRDGMMSIPERVACGDLDGDLYLVCWDEIIVSYMTNAEPLVDRPCEDDGVVKTGAASNSWLDDAHELMVDAASVNVMGRLTGTLYKLSEKEADNSPLLKRDPNAIAFATAYNQALEFRKHGGRIYLPEHLHEKLPKGLREYVTGFFH